MKSILLYGDDEHRFYLLGWEDVEEEGIVQTNQYLIIDKGEGVLLDPGGAHVFPRVLANVAELIELKKLKVLFFTHQDPDVTSGITMWLKIAENAKLYISELWTRFLPHFGIYDRSRVIGIPDRGTTIPLKSGVKLEVLPAHYLHSTGNHIVYDPRAKILFSGDIGVSLFAKGKRKQIVEDNLSSHVKLMELFHKRYMTSNIACRKWVSIVEKYDIDYIAPQHGAVMKGKITKEFLEWFKNLRCGVDIINEIYGR